MPHLEKVSVFCFFASYVVALGLELTQFLRSSRVNRWAAIGFTGAGLVAQTMYLVHRSRVSDMPPLIGSMHDWLLVLAWVAAAVYLVLELRDRRLGLGVFLLPLVLLLVSSSTSMKQEPQVRDAQYAVEMFHASLLVFGIAGVTVGFLLSLMYLVQHNRLRHKTPDPDSLQLYSLERLGRMNWWAVVSSVPLLTLGMLAGVCLAWKSRSTSSPVDLFAPGFIVMYALWLAMIVLLGWLVTRSQSSGKIVAWRTLWACGFLLVTMLCLEVFTGGIHGKKRDRGTGTSARPGLSARVIHHGGTEWLADSQTASTDGYDASPQRGGTSQPRVATQERTLGSADLAETNPEGVPHRVRSRAGECTAPSGLVTAGRFLPGCAPTSRPWAVVDNPFGVFLGPQLRWGPRVTLNPQPSTLNPQCPVEAHT